VPTIIAYLLNGADPTPAQAAACRGVRFARSASAPLPPSSTARSKHGSEYRAGSDGLTECASVAFANPLDSRARKLGSPGLPLGMHARVVATDGTVLGDGERGEIELQGANVMLRYHDDPRPLRARCAGRAGSRPATLGYRDTDGFYFITGRLKELIIKAARHRRRARSTSAPRPPAVLEAAAVGIPDPEYGQEILACVVLKPRRPLHRGRICASIASPCSAATRRRRPSAS